MDLKGGCCIARYGGLYGLSKADRIMLRFRPIAPKPASDGVSQTGSLVATNSSSSSPGSGTSDVSTKSGRGGKRKNYQKESSGGGYTKKCTRRKRSGGGDDDTSAVAVTLSLLPETKPAFLDLNVSPVEKQKRAGPLWLSFSGGGQTLTPSKAAEIPRRRVVVSSCVTVEKVTDAWNDGYKLGKSDKEKMMNLMSDTCPGFISDGAGRVTWTNEAYKKMAMEKEGSPENDIRLHVIVRLVMKERPMLAYSAFTCRVRLQYTCRDREGGSVTVPCDVWRMDGGGFAWRLDVKAALCL